MIMLDRVAPEPGKGWGCLVCNLPSDGATVVLCDDCLEIKPQPLGNIIFGYPKENMRIKASAYPFQIFKHDEYLHWAYEHRTDEISF